jgi:hypothetical protein
VENLNVSTRHGCRFHFRQIRATDANDTPSSRASSRADQCVTPNDGGGFVMVATTTSASSIRRGRPGRSSSASPAIPRSR